MKEKNLDVLFVCGSKSDELFAEVAASRCRYWGYISHDQLVEILSAADFYIHPAFHPKFGGLDVSWMEALACNIPVMSPQLSELDFDFKPLGISLNSMDQVYNRTKYMIEHFLEFKNCRHTAKKYLDANNAIIDKLFKVMTEKK